MQIDRRDIKILSILQKNARIKIKDLAAECNLSVTPCWQRIKKLEKAGIISGYRAAIELSKLRKHTEILVSISLKNHRAIDFKNFEDAIKTIPYIISCKAVGGGIDYFLTIIADDIDHYQRIMEDILERDIGVNQYYTYVITKSIVSHPAYPDEILSPEDDL